MSIFKRGDIVRRTGHTFKDILKGELCEVVRATPYDLYLKGKTGIAMPTLFELVSRVDPTLEEIRAKWAELQQGLYQSTVDIEFNEFLNPPPPKPPTAEEVLLGVIDDHRGGLWTDVSKVAITALRTAGYLKED